MYNHNEKLRSIIIPFVLFIILSNDVVLIGNNKINIEKDFVTHATEIIMNMKEGQDKSKAVFNLSNLFLDLGYDTERIFDIYDSISEDAYKESLLLSLIDKKGAQYQKHIEKIKKKIELIDDELIKFDLYLKLCSLYASKNDKETALFYLKKINDLKEDLDLELIVNLFEAYKPLVRIGLKDEAFKIIKDFKDNPFRNKEFTFLLNIVVPKYLELGLRNDALKILADVKNEIEFIEDDFKKSSLNNELGKTFFILEDYEQAAELIKNSFSIENCIKNKERKLTFLSELISSETRIYEKFQFDIDQVQKILIGNVVYIRRNYKFNDPILVEMYNRQILELLILSGRFETAKEIALKLDETSENSDARKIFDFQDYFYYYLGVEYLRDPSLIGNAIQCVERITHHKSLKFNLLMEIMKRYMKKETSNIFLKLSRKAIFLLNEINTDRSSIDEDWGTIGFPIKPHPEGEISLCLIKMGFQDEAFKILEKIVNKNVKSVLLYEFAQHNLREKNIDSARMILRRYNINAPIKALIISKIAAKFMVDGNDEEGSNMFKNALDLMIKSEPGLIDIVLDDYLNAKKFHRIIGDNAWERMNIVD